ncbi:MAG: tetratricopeptide repeat protein [Steroidobacteraceae bacterium]
MPAMTCRRAAILFLPLLLAAARSSALDAPPRALGPQAALAELALQSGDCRRAAELYLQLARSSRDVALARRATDVAVGCEQLPVAWDAATQWRARDPENVEALRSQGLIALRLWRIDAAREAFGTLLGKPDVEPDRALAELLPLVTEGGQAPGAWQVFGRIVPRATAAPATLLALARLALAADDAGAARELLALLRTRVTADADVDRIAARVAVLDGDAAAALAAAREAAQLDPAGQAFAPAETLVDLDRAEEAHAELEALLADPALHDEADRRLALLAIGTGDFDEARRRFGARLQAGASTAESLFYLAIIAERRGDATLALQGYRRLVDAGAGLIARTRAAALLIASGKNDEGLALLDDFARREPDQAVEVAVARAQLLVEGGSARDALASLDASIKSWPGHPDLLYQRAMLFERAGRTRDAVRQFEALLAQRPGDATVQNALGYTLADRRLQLPRAEQLIRAALASRPDDAAFLDSLGWVRYRRGDPRGALPWLERAWRLSQDAEIAAHWGEVLWEAGSQGEARTIWARALARSPDSKPLHAVIERYTAKR